MMLQQTELLLGQHQLFGLEEQFPTELQQQTKLMYIHFLLLIMVLHGMETLLNITINL
jgi:hypothetical protein